MTTSRTLAALTLLLLGGCAVSRPPEAAHANVPAQWHAPLPHNGALVDLTRWWQRFGDPLLVELIDAAQQASPGVAAAGSRIAQARAARIAAGESERPRLDASASLARGNVQAPPSLTTTAQVGLQTAWEIDVFGGNAAASRAAQARLQGAQAGWHEARVAVAAETAGAYVGYRTCEQQRALVQQDARSRADSARLLQLSTDAGFTPPGQMALARASAAEGAARATQQAAQCESELKALVALTGLAEPDLRQKLQMPWAEPSSEALAAIPSLPASVIAQRPDVYQAELDVAAASNDVGQARAAQYPRVSLSGSIAAGRVRLDGATTNAQTWQIGPLAVTLPILGRESLAASTDAAQARYDEAVLRYAAAVRQAVREVEAALVNVASVRERGADVEAAAQGYRASFAATESLHRAGLASLIDLEDQRRAVLAAETALVTLRRERVAAGIALYRAVGGGWARPGEAIQTFGQK